MRYLLGLMFIISFCAQATPKVWKIQSNKPQNSSLLQIEQRMMRQIEQASQGELVFMLKADNGFVGLREAYNAVRTGEIDAMLMTPSYWSAADPVFSIMGDLVAAWNSPAQYVKWLEKAQGIRYLERAYRRVGLRLLGYAVAPAESLVSTKPLSSVEDIAGLVMRAPPGMISDFFTLLGARPRNISAGKAIKALARGRIDMADFSDLSVNAQVGAYTHAKHTNYPGFHSMPLYDFVVREQSWQALSERERQIVLQAVERWQFSSYQVTGEALAKALQETREQGVTLHRWDDSELKRARRQARVVWDNYARKSDEALALIAELTQWLVAEGNLE
ncbi:MAG: TRAP transporter substrate-binding protein DctP [Pseudomonadales bacterium]